MADKKTTQLIVREQTHISGGTSAGGSSWNLWQVVATRPDGTAIEENLRTFDDNLPKNIVIDVTVEPFKSTHGAMSYTIERQGASRRQAPNFSKDIAEIREELAALTEKLGNLWRIVHDRQQPAQPAPTPPPPPAQAVGDGMPNDDDIPF